mmetsp:Transcript_26011/g.60890  ORF Transcript_26011/g.60890 Transcript_26011/m.60890 type:complete len:374 (+) Transcript_26011:810-1931(+)
MLPVVVHFNDLQPELVEDIAIQCRMPSAPERDEERDGFPMRPLNLVDRKWEWVAVGHLGLIAINRPLVALENANTSLLLLQEEACLVPEWHHQSHAVQADLGLNALLVDLCFDLTLLQYLHLLFQLLLLQLLLKSFLLFLLLLLEALDLSSPLFFEYLFGSIRLLLGFGLELLELTFQGLRILVLHPLAAVLEHRGHSGLLGLSVRVEGSWCALVWIHLASQLVDLQHHFLDVRIVRIRRRVFFLRMLVVMRLQGLGLLVVHLHGLAASVVLLVEQVEEVEESSLGCRGLAVLCFRFRDCLGPQPSLHLLLGFSLAPICCALPVLLQLAHAHAELRSSLIPNLFGHLRQRPFLSSLEGRVGVFWLRFLARAKL